MQNAYTHRWEFTSSIVHHPIICSTLQRCIKSVQTGTCSAHKEHSYKKEDV